LIDEFVNLLQFPWNMYSLRTEGLTMPATDAMLRLAHLLDGSVKPDEVFRAVAAVF
jgi:hypothetical protein